MRPTLLALAAAALLAGCGPAADEGPGESLSVRDAWVRPAPPGASMTAAYLVIANEGPDPAALTGARSPLFSIAEIHETFVADGVSRMRERPRVEIPPGGELALAPGGLHVMLMRPAGPMPSAGPVPLTLVFEDGRQIEIAAPLGQPGGP